MDTNRAAVPNSPGGPNLRVDSAAGAAPGRKPRRSIHNRTIGGLLLAMPLLLTLRIIGWLYSILELKVIDPLVGLLLWKLKWTTSWCSLAPLPNDSGNAGAFTVPRPGWR